MGLDLQAHAKRGILRRRSWADLCEGISAAARDAEDDLLRRLMHTSQGDGAFFVTLHPAEEPVRFFLDVGGALVCAARTSTAGPGYHAHLVEWLEALGRRLRMTWRLDGASDGDETGYWDHRDFARLQGAHADWLGGLAGAVIEQLQARGGAPSGLTPILVGLPEGAPLPASSPGGIASGMGYWDRAFFDELAAGDSATRCALAARFFPWWDAERDARFWDGVGRYLAWTEVPWHPATDPKERFLYDIVLDAFERVRTMDPTRPLPEAEIAELRTLLADSPDGNPPASDGIGFCRREVDLPLAGSWRVQLPGYFHNRVVDDGKVRKLWFGNRAIQVTSMSFRGKDGGDMSPEQSIAIFEAPADAVWHRSEHVVGFATVAREEATEGAVPGWCVDGRVATTNGVLHIVFSLAEEADCEWALDVWRSVTHPPPIRMTNRV